MSAAEVEAVHRKHYAAPNRAHCACGWKGTVDARFTPDYVPIAQQYAAHLAEQIAPLIERARAEELREAADENESWEWRAPVGPGNASYANGYENGRRAVGAELRARADRIAEPLPVSPEGRQAQLADLADRWDGTRDGVLGPGLRRAADDLRALGADREWFRATVERRGREVAPASPDSDGQEPAPEGVRRG